MSMLKLWHIISQTNNSRTTLKLGEGVIHPENSPSLQHYRPAPDVNVEVVAHNFTDKQFKNYIETGGRHNPEKSTFLLKNIQFDVLPNYFVRH